jgi:hypothetical protein
MGLLLINAYKIYCSVMDEADIPRNARRTHYQFILEIATAWIDLKEKKINLIKKEAKHHFEEKNPSKDAAATQTTTHAADDDDIVIINAITESSLQWNESLSCWLWPEPTSPSPSLPHSLTPKRSKPQAPGYLAMPSPICSPVKGSIILNFSTAQNLLTARLPSVLSTTGLIMTCNIKMALSIVATVMSTFASIFSNSSKKREIWLKTRKN